MYVLAGKIQHVGSLSLGCEEFSGRISNEHAGPQPLPRGQIYCHVGVIRLSLL